MDNLGEEWGISLKIKRQALLKQVQFEIKACTYDSVKIRINIHTFDSETQEAGEFLLSEPLYTTVGKYANSRKYIVDIPEMISVDRAEILLSFEIVQFFGEGHIHVPAYKGSGYVRTKVMEKLEKVPFNSGISILALFEK
jgi:hypothetical protein